jgi:hypothetical protein
MGANYFVPRFLFIRGFLQVLLFASLFNLVGLLLFIWSGLRFTSIPIPPHSFYLFPSLSFPLITVLHAHLPLVEEGLLCHFILIY